MYSTCYLSKERPCRIHVKIGSKLLFTNHDWCLATHHDYPIQHRLCDPITFVLILISTFFLIYQCIIIHLDYPIITNVRMTIIIASRGPRILLLSQSKRDKTLFNNLIALNIIYACWQTTFIVSD